MCTALQAVASPLGHSTVGSNAVLRADDGIRTRDPHLGKVMRYQLRYIRVPRAGSPPGAKTDNSRPVGEGTNHPVACRLQPLVQRKCLFVLIFVPGAGAPSRASGRPRSRGSVGERPLHTRKVAGSIPAGTTSGFSTSSTGSGLFQEPRARHVPKESNRNRSFNRSQPNLTLRRDAPGGRYGDRTGRDGSPCDSGGSGRTSAAPRREFN